MSFSEQYRPAAWGAVGGAALAIIVGFNFGGWVTGGTAEREASQRVQAAVVSALAPICADRFLQQANVTVSLAELKKTDSLDRAPVIEKGGFATMQGSKDSVSGVARACADILAKPNV